MTAVADPALSARAAQLLFTYARVVDAGDLDGLNAIVTDDIVIDRAEGARSGREPFLDVYREFNASPAQGSHHVITNVQAFPEDGGPIRAESYFRSYVFNPDGTTTVIVGSYSDLMRDEDGTLRFTRKGITIERVFTSAA